MEGPSVKVVAEKLNELMLNEIIHNAWGNSKKIDFKELINKKINDVFSYGKNLFFNIEGVGYIKIHFLMYGSYSIDELIKERNKVRLALENKHKAYFYNCSVTKLVKVENQKVKDILDEKWNVNEMMNLLKDKKGIISDILLDQNIFPGVGNIIKNEALYLAKIHPASKIEKLGSEKLLELLEKLREFSILFYRVRKENKRLKNFLKAYAKKTCSICNNKINRIRIGERKRISYFCSECQKLY
jgi:endonuclease-8